MHLQENNKKKEEEAAEIKEVIAECKETLNRLKDLAMADPRTASKFGQTSISVAESSKRSGKVIIKDSSAESSKESGRESSKEGGSRESSSRESKRGKMIEEVQLRDSTGGEEGVS